MHISPVLGGALAAMTEAVSSMGVGGSQKRGVMVASAREAKLHFAEWPKNAAEITALRSRTDVGSSTPHAVPELCCSVLPAAEEIGTNTTASRKVWGARGIRLEAAEGASSWLTGSPACWGTW